MSSPLAKVTEKITRNIFSESNYRNKDPKFTASTKSKCLLDEISIGGGSLLLPKSMSVPSKQFSLEILSSNNQKETLAVLEVDVKWLDDGYTELYKKIGFQFIERGPARERVIEALVFLVSLHGKKKLACNICSIV